MERIAKVAVVTLRDSRGFDEVLVFDHPLEGGGSVLQLPAGTIEVGEAPDDAALRELLEETGVHGEIRVLAGALDEDYEGQGQRRWVYLVDAPEGLPDEWPFACDCGVTIRCHWLPFSDATVVEAQQPWMDLAHSTG